MSTTLTTIEKWLANLGGLVAAGAMIFMMLSTALDATSRSLFNYPLPGVYEFSEIAMALIVYLGLWWTQLDRKHIRVSMISEHRPPRLRHALEGIGWAFAALFLLFLSVPSFEGAYASFVDREFRWGIVQMPIWWVKIVVAIGLALAFLQMLLHTLRSLRLACGGNHD